MRASGIKRFFKKTDSPVQGEPVRAFIKVTNIGNSVCKGLKIKDGCFSFPSVNLMTEVQSDFLVNPLNPNEEKTVEIKRHTFSVHGASFFDCKLEPESKYQLMETYQYDRYHKIDEFYEDCNEWGNSVYVESRQASLQAKTNQYILALTVITVIEAGFGLQEMLRFFVTHLGDLLSYLGAGIKGLG
jgi:hypothetical protein